MIRRRRALASAPADERCAKSPPHRQHPAWSIHHGANAVVYVLANGLADGRRGGDTLFDRIAEEVTRPSELEIESIVPSSNVDAVHDEPLTRVIDPSRQWPAPDISTQIDRPSVAERQCSRSGCSDPAAVTLSYHYGQSQVWIDRLTPEREPHAYDMCDQHADRLSVPQGWRLDDRRGARRGSLIAV